MTKNVYMTPYAKIDEAMDLEQLLTTISGGSEGIPPVDPNNPGSGDSSDPTDPNNDNRSRNYNCWDDGEDFY